MLRNLWRRKADREADRLKMLRVRAEAMERLYAIDRKAEARQLTRREMRRWKRAKGVVDRCSEELERMEKPPPPPAPTPLPSATRGSW